MLAVVLFFATFAMTVERVHPPAEQKSSLKTDLRDLGRNTPWVVLCIVGVAALTYANIRGRVIIYCFDHVVPNGKEDFSSVMVTAPLSKNSASATFT